MSGNIFHCIFGVEHDTQDNITFLTFAMLMLAHVSKQYDEKNCD